MNGSSPEQQTAQPDTNADRILIVEDDDGFREVLHDELTDAGHTVDTAECVEDARRQTAAERPAAIICDLRLPDGTGLDLFEHLDRREDLVQPGFVLITAFGSISEAVDALKRGVDDFLTKPVDFDELLLRLQRLLEVQQLRVEVDRYRRHAADPDFHQMIGQSPAMEDLYDRIRRIADTDAPVVVTGESGTGKELTARALHAESARADQPFVPVNCAGIPASLVESEFFGHTSGAFTGADEPRTGLFEEADGGTLFLDEITELPRSLQAKLLRALQEKTIRPVGSNEPKSIDVRTVAATNRDLETALDDDSLREDLYYRLATFTLDVPPLRERDGDIPRLVSYFLHHSDIASGSDIDGMTEACLDALDRYHFPGNVRELKNLVERAAVYARGDMIDRDDLPDHTRQSTADDSDRSTSGPRQTLSVTTDNGSLVPMETLKRRYAHLALNHTDDNKKRAAQLLDVGRRTLYRYLDHD